MTNSQSRHLLAPYFLQRLRPFAWVLLACVSGLLAGCPGKPAISEGVRKSRQSLLPIGKSQEAVDALANDKSPDAHFLRAVAMYRLHLPDPAGVELKKAIELTPENPVFRAYQICMEMQANDISHADELMKLYEDNKSSAPIALFAVSGFAKKNDLKSAVTSFRTSVALSDEAPEFLPEMLNFALTTQQTDEAQTILSKMDKISPDDPLLTHSRIAVLMMSNKFEEAQRKAKVYFTTQNNSEAAGVLYAKTLSSGAASPNIDEQLADLAQRFPRNLDILTMYATYLARSQRLPKAMELLNHAAEVAGADAKSTIVNIAVDLPLQAEDVKIAEAQLEKYRPVLPKNLLLIYYEGRLLVLKKDFKGAVAKFTEIVETAKKENTQGSRASLAYQAVLWLRKLQADKKIQDGMQSLLEKYTGELPDPPAKAPPAGKAPPAVKKDAPKDQDTKAPAKAEPPKAKAKVDEAPKAEPKVEAPKKAEPKKDEPSKVESR